MNIYNLQIGDEICIPTDVYEEEERRYYSTKAGDNLSMILENMDTDIAKLFEFNKELYNITLPLGTILRIPPK